MGDERFGLIRQLRHLNRSRRQARAAIATSLIIKRTPKPRSTIPLFLNDEQKQVQNWDRGQCRGVLDDFVHAKYGNEGLVPVHTALYGLADLLVQFFRGGGQDFAPELHFTLQAFNKLSNEKSSWSRQCASRVLQTSSLHIAS